MIVSRKRKSFQKAWRNAVCDKSPSFPTKQSTVPVTLCHLPCYRKDSRQDLVLWLLLTNDEYFYENSLQCLAEARNFDEELYNTIRLSRLPSDWPEKLTELYYVARGNYGTVYRATDVETGQFLAIKNISLANIPPGTEDEGGLRHLLGKLTSVMVERDALIKSNNGGFNIQLRGAFQDNRIGSFWFVFDYCARNLQNLFDSLKTQASLIDEMLKGAIMKEMYQLYKNTYNFDYEYIVYLYVYELCAALGYLADRRLIHNDFKPDNVLISAFGHLKVTDLGIVQRMRWIHRFSAMDFVEEDEFEAREAEHMMNAFQGTIGYSDPESLIYFELTRRHSLCNRGGKKTFLSDLYAVGLIALQLILMGIDILAPKNLSKKLMKRFNLTQSDINRKQYLIEVVYGKQFHTNYLVKILDNQKQSYNTEFFDFIKSIFNSRHDRATDYTSLIEVYFMSDKKNVKVIDMEKVDKIDIFSELKFNRFTTLFIKPEESFMQHLGQPNLENLVADNFDDLLEYLEENESPCKHVPLPQVNFR